MKPANYAQWRMEQYKGRDGLYFRIRGRIVEHVNAAKEREFNRLASLTYPISTLYTLARFIGL